MRSLTFIRAALLAAALCAPLAHADNWSAPQEPFQIYGNTWYVGPHGVSAVLITSPAGHILVDGGSPESAEQIAAHIRQLGFRLEDIRYILNSHEHIDHAGGIAELQRLSGAVVLGSAKSEPVLRTGRQDKGDPQYDPDSPPMAPIANTRVVRDGEVVKVGPLAVTAHYTPGHTQGGISWTWRATDGDQSASFVYADSLTAFTAGSFRYSHNTVYPTALSDIEHSIDTVAGLDCDILVSTHPEVSDLWKREARRATLGSQAFVDPHACRAYAGKAKANLHLRLQEEAKQG